MESTFVLSTLSIFICDQGDEVGGGMATIISGDGSFGGITGRFPGVLGWYGSVNDSGNMWI